MTRKAVSFVFVAATFGLTSCRIGERSRLPVAAVEAEAETEQVAGQGDAADDPAIWLAPDPEKSLILGTDKVTGLYAYTLDGKIHAYLPVGRINNVDVRSGFDAGGRDMALVAASDRTAPGLALFLIDPETRELTSAPGGTIPLDFAEPYGACLYRSPVDGDVFAFITDKDPGTVAQFRLYWADGRIKAEEVRRFRLGTISEGCVADDRTGLLYVAEERVAIWRIGAEPDDGTEGESFAAVDGERIVPDAEGLAILPEGRTGGWLFVSSQGDNAFGVFELETGAFVNRFRIVEGPTDAATGSDGIEVFAGNLGRVFPGGVFLAQDGENEGGGQNFKIVNLESVRRVLGIRQ